MCFLIHGNSLSTLTGNIRSRRGSKVAINVPIYKDVNTPSPFVDPSIPYDRQLWPGDSEAKNGAAKPDHIYMDAMAFGMGCCCLQITFQAFNVDEARRMYDALVPVAPIMVSRTLSCYTSPLTQYMHSWLSQHAVLLSEDIWLTSMRVGT